MKAIYRMLAGMGLFGLLIILGIAGFSIAMCVYGLYLAFSASILLGITALFVEPSPFIIGIVMFFFHKDLAQTLIDYLTK